MSPLLGPLFSSDAMRAITADEARLQRMLDVEAALTRTEAALGIIPAAAVAPIVAACVASAFDGNALARDSASAGNLAIPLVKALTQKVCERDKDAAGYVHWGATSQDIIDTALVLELRDGIAALTRDLDRAVEGFVAQAERHRETLVAGRTWLQHALPVPFALKLAGYAASLARSRRNLFRTAQENLVLQFGGASGTLAALDDRGTEIAEALGRELGLPVPDAPWHAHRDRLVGVASALAIVAGACAKIARDVTLLMQSEVGEAYESGGAGRGGSSTMPQKRNPVSAAAALSAAAIAPNLTATLLNAQAHEHERATGAWQAEWPTYPALLLTVSGSVASVADIAEGLEVDTARMRENLDRSGGLIMAEAVSFALAEKVGKSAAHALVERAARAALRDRTMLHAALACDPEVTAILPPDVLARALEPQHYLGAAQTFIDRLLASARER